ncbi:GHKL domain-containing protein [Anaerocolumna sedimenticola]|uniref:GHKL domain-containing protein n=1 Tax=Anaerocolumna sedimenticola TaxID=2696063 RepID=A0A6P1TS88_9FIRM|nr:GHKL domain-containing protein [Anaerocolumna sedimenticola]QHQ62365.1 GHKL domain-containing protein [Anaerocolumna sedimenticola]
MNEILYWMIGLPIQVLIGFLCSRVLNILVPFRKELWRQIFLFIGCWLLTGMIIFVGDFANLPPTIIIFLITVFLGCGGSRLQKTTVALMVASTAFAFNALADSYFRIGSYLPPRVFFWLMLYLLMRHYGPPKNYELTPPMWRLLLLLTATPLGIVLSLVLLQTPYYDHSDPIMLSNFVLLLIAVLSFVGLLWTVTVLARQRRLEQQEQLYEFNRAYYQALEKQQFEVRRVRHDMANHLQILMSLPENEKNSYVEELIHLPVMQNSIHYCENQVVNAVINAKITLIEQADIKLNHSLFVPEGGNMEKSELCALFANVLDNAIEACLKLPQKQREITLEVRAEKGLLVCRISNSMNDTVKSEQGLPVTSKRDKNLHGYGLRNIQEIVERYHGQMEIETGNGKFSLFFYLPYYF